ncbi:MAG: hypothetical protein RBR97_07525 [Bacteroidales bacterium]|nr:hypothetical protein [Bacteroidales bacterium]
MKKLSILLVLVGAAAIFFSSCNKEYAEPTITWTPDGSSQFVNIDDVTTHNKTLAIAFTAEAGIKEITIWKHTYKMLDIESEVFASPTGYAGLTDFSHVLTTDNVLADFGGGVTKIVYEVEITDDSETPQSTTKSYTFMIDEAYAVTINVKDGEGNAITDAKVTFNSVEKTEAPYVFEYIMEGTYAYMVEKAGYTSVNVTDFVMPDKDTTVNVELVMNLSAWSDDVMISLLDGAYYNHIAVPDHENTTIGFKYLTNPTTPSDHAKVVKTTNCTGWVEVTSDTYTTQAELATAYSAGTEIYEAFLGFDYEEAKAFAGKIFIAKFGNDYVLVKYIAGLTCPADHTATTGNKGNVLVFQYKN